MTSEERQAQPELREYLRVLRRRKGTIALATLIVLAIALVSSFQTTPIYKATTEIVLQSRSTEALFNANGNQISGATGAATAQTQIRILEGKLVRDGVARAIGSAPPISANQVGDTDVLQINRQDAKPEQAARVANAYADAYISLRREQAVNDLLEASKQIQMKITDLQKQIDDIDSQVNNVPEPQKSSIRQNLAPQKDSLIQQQGLFKQKIDQLQVDAALKTGGAELVTPASVPTTPIKPTPRRTGVLGLAVGLLLGVGLAFLFEYLDDSIKSKEDLDRVAAGLPVLGLIPVVQEWKSKDDTFLVGREDPQSSASEAYRTLRTALQFLALDQPMRTLQVTSAAAREGKTTTLANLAVTLAQAGQRVVIVSCDLRRPRVHEFFGLSNAVGLTSVLLGKVGLSAALQRVPGIDRLWVLASGPIPPNPSELLASRRTMEVLTSLQPMADIVLVDSPPVLPVTDSLVLAGRVDATLVVCVAGVTTRKEVARTIELLLQVGAPLVGTVLNGLAASSASDYGYEYYRREAIGRRREAAEK